jgi:uncharacterized protein YxjI
VDRRRQRQPRLRGGRQGSSPSGARWCSRIRPGNPLYQINQSLAHLHTTFEIKRGDEVVATVQKALLNILGDHFTIELAGGEQLTVTGDWIAREFHVDRGGIDVILASRNLLSLHGAYGVQVAPGFDTPLAMAIVIALEQMELQEGHR